MLFHFFADHEQMDGIAHFCVRSVKKELNIHGRTVNEPRAFQSRLTRSKSLRRMRVSTSWVFRLGIPHRSLIHA